MKIELPKFCIFCGKKPESKTKEHIIPQWLIKLTGDLNREIVIGNDVKHFRKTGESRLLKFSFNAFQFPACDTCNNEYSQLEASTKNIIEKILSNDYISEIEINILLDWFDKVRIGLWLGLLLLNREDAPVTPKFHIKNRIGEKDRSLFIYEMKNDNWKGIQFTAINSPIFIISPSCFALRINQYYFFNISYDFLFSKNIGFPYPKLQEFLNESEEIETQLVQGTHKINIPLLHTKLLEPSIAIYQPMISKKLFRRVDESEKSEYDNDYVKENCLNYDNGQGSIFYSEGKRIVKLDSETEISFSSSKLYDVNQLQILISQQVVDHQAYLIKKTPSTKNLSDEQKEHIAKSIKETLDLQNYYRSFIK